MKTKAKMSPKKKIVIAVGAVAVITGAFDFNAAKFSTWGHGTSFFECLLYEFIV